MKFMKLYSKFTHCLWQTTLVVVLSFLLLACGENLLSEVLVQETPIDITTIVGTQEMQLTTRTAETGLNNGAFTVSGTSDYNKVYLRIGTEDHAYTIDGTTSTSTTLIKDEESYFPTSSSSVNVYGHYPYSEGFSTEGGKTYFTINNSQKTVDQYLMSDLMTADNSPATRTQNANGTWTVNKTACLDFKHQMTKIVVSASTEEESGLTITSVKLMGVKPRVELSYDESSGEYSIGSAQKDAEGHCYDLEVLTSSGTAAVIIPPQRYEVESEDALTPEQLAAYKNDHHNIREFLKISAHFVNPDNNTDERDVDFLYYFTEDGKLFKPNHVYNVSIVFGKLDVGIINELYMSGVELVKWASDDDANNVHIYAAEEKKSMFEGSGIQIINNAGTKIYNGQPHTLKVNSDNLIEGSEDELILTIDKDGTLEKLVCDDDYTLHYSTNVNAGTANISIMGIGRYAGSLGTSFTISPKSIDDETVSVEIPSPTYNKGELNPSPVIVDSETGATLSPYDYATSNWTNNVHAGTNTASVLISGRVNYTGNRTEHFSINKASGSVTFDPIDISMILPKGRQYTYYRGYTIHGDGVLQNCSSTDETVATVDNQGNFTAKKAGTTNIRFHIEGNDYDYSDVPSYALTITQGPKLPLEYVALYNMKSATTMASDNQSRNSCWLTWDQDASTALSTLKKNGINKDGVHYHLPSSGELESVFPTGSAIYWGGSGSNQGTTNMNQSDAHVKFGVTTSRTTSLDDTDYTWAITTDDTQNWESDIYSINKTSSSYDVAMGNEAAGSNGDGIAYGLRFKNSTYCSAYRWDYIWTTSSNQSLTGNTIGRKSVVVRVIYLGPLANSSSYGLAQLQALDWSHPDVTRSFPMTGAAYNHDYEAGYPNDANAGVGGYGNSGDRPSQNWFWSATRLSETNYLSVRLVVEGLQGYQNHHKYHAFSVRLFQDYE